MIQDIQLIRMRSDSEVEESDLVNRGLQLQYCKYDKI